MDNLCHTLFGAALGEAGLKRATPLAMATLLVGANLPDVDAVTYVFADAPTSVEFRRGWTHGALAMGVLPLALAGAMAAWDRFVRRRRHPEKTPARFPALLLLAFVSVLSHPCLDFLNTYGVRFLYPFSRRWFYGDTRSSSWTPGSGSRWRSESAGRRSAGATPIRKLPLASLSARPPHTSA